MSSKSSNLNLYSVDNLDEKALHVQSTDAVLTMASPNLFKFQAPQFELAGQTDPSHDVSNLGLYLKTLSNTVDSNSTTQAAQIATNTTNIANLTATESANHAAQATLLGAETGRATTAETTLQANIDAESTARQSADSAITADVTTKHNQVLTSLAAEVARAEAAEEVNAQAIAALQVIDTDTLAQINQMLTDYQAADNSITNQITAIQNQLTTLQDQVDVLLA